MPGTEGAVRRFRREGQLLPYFLPLLPQRLRSQGQNAFRVHIAHHAQDHIGRGIKGLVAQMQPFRGNFGNGLPGAENGHMKGMVPVHFPHQAVKADGIRVIQIGVNFLTDDLPLLLHGLLGKIRGGHEGQQQPQAVRKMMSGRKVIGRQVMAGKGVGAGAHGGELRVHVMAGQVEHLVLEIMGHPCRGVIFFSLEAEIRMQGTEICDEIGAFPGKARSRHHQHRQSVGKNAPIEPLADGRIILHAFTPLSKNSEWKRTWLAASTTSSSVTASSRA